jgi:uncharacterized protein (UPF0332 family)
VKADTRAHLDRARQFLARADACLGLLPQQALAAEDAARNAYYAAFHAAQALIFERTGGKSKKHGSVHRGFTDVTKNDVSVDAQLRKFPTKAYEFKRVGDYETGSGVLITPTDAQDAVTEAKRFVSVVAALLP